MLQGDLDVVEAVEQPVLDVGIEVEGGLEPFGGDRLVGQVDGHLRPGPLLGQFGEAGDLLG